MPSSAWEHNEWARQKVASMRRRNPGGLKVLDIGPGSGKWPKVLAGRTPEHRTVVDDSHWTGLEVFPRYVLDYDLMTALYDRIIIDDVRNLARTDLVYYAGIDYPIYDLIIAGDILEHVQRSEAAEVMETLIETDSALLIAGPIIEFEQGEWGGNVHETHHWHPTVDDYLELVKPDDYVLGDIIGLFWRVPR